MGSIADLIGPGLGEDGASSEIKRVFQHDQAGLGAIVDTRRNALLDLLPGDDPIFAIDRTRLASGKGRYGRRFKVDDVGTLFADDLLSMMRVDLDGNLVAHGAGGNKNGGFPPENLCGPLLQPVDRGVFTINVIANLSFSHGAAHFGSRLGDGVAAQVNRRSRVVCFRGGAFWFSQFCWHSEITRKARWRAPE